MQWQLFRDRAIMPRHDSGQAMFDPAILLALQNIPMPPERPQVAIEQSWLSNVAAQAERRGKISADSYQNFATGWVAEVHKIMAEIDILRAAGAFDRDALARVLSLAIDDLESDAETRAISNARLEKKINRTVKPVFQDDPSLAAVLRSFGERLLATEKHIIDEMLEFSLFLRATRSELLPNIKSSAVFQNPGDLEAHLTAELA